MIGHNTNANLIDWLGDPSLNLWAVLVEASWRQAGYVMVLYLAGLKAVDANLRRPRGSTAPTPGRRSGGSSSRR